MGRYLRLLEEAAEKRKRDKYAISPNKYAVSPDEDTIVPDLPRLSRNRVTASADYEKKKKDNDIKEEEYYTSIIDGKFVVEAEGGAEKYALNAVSLFEALKIPPQNAATLRHSTGNTHKAEPDSSGPPRPPDLQELVARHGGYSSITPEAWAEWDRLNAEWKSACARYYGQTIKISVGRA